MSVTIHYLDPAIFGAEPADPGLERIEAGRGFVEALVRALVARDSEAKGLCGLIFEDDDQFGWCASEVHPQELAAAVAGLPAGLAPFPGLTRFLDHVAANRFTVTVDENRDRAHLGMAPTLRSTLERVDEPVLNWSNAHAQKALRALGYASYETDGGRDFPAAELVSACHRAGGRDALLIAEVASYALAVGGADAMVSVA